MTERPFPEPDDKLKATNPYVKRFIFALEAENLKLQTQIAQCQAGQVTLKNRIVALEQVIKENRPDFNLIVNLGDGPKS